MSRDLVGNNYVIAASYLLIADKLQSLHFVKEVENVCEKAKKKKKKKSWPKIKFYLFAIAYLPTLLPPTQLPFFCFPELIFFFVLLFRYFSFSLKY